MELIRGSYNLKPAHRGCVATIGNFDGVHRGHQQVLRGLIEKGAALSLPSCVISFEPLPLEHFSPKQAPARLLRLPEKMHALSMLGVDRLLLLRFNHNLSEQTAEEFIKHTLVEALGIRYLVVGDDFKFGCARSGDFELLQQAGRDFDFEVAATHTFDIDGERVSSTRIRGLLAEGEMEAAAQLLGRPYELSGKVIHGFKRGRTIGFPTANILTKRLRCPIEGVFAISALDRQGNEYPGVANIGVRPTVGGTPKPLLEAHLFNFSGDLYGQPLSVNFLHKIRTERKFDSFELLKAQILQDADDARTFFQQRAELNL